MPRYIDSEEIKYTKFVQENDSVDGVGGLCALKSHIDSIPTADVQEVRHGRWMYCGKASGHDHMWQCSECLRTEFTKHKADIKDYPYCHCGARMDGKE